MAKIAVIGCGMVGSAMALDLAKNHQVKIADLNEENLSKIVLKNPSVKTVRLDVTDRKALESYIQFADIVLCAVPGFLGFKTLKTIIEAGKNVVDISFFPENALELDYLAKEKNITAIVDCGVAPGIDNLILGYYDTKFKIQSFECLVGGLPKEKKWPFYYKAPFSPIDVIEEYTRPARYVENGQIVVKPAMSDAEYIYFDKIGTLESFNTDGLRSIIYTMSHIPDMKEKTLRYPGHIQQILALKESGFLSTEPMKINNTSVRPVDFTCKILFDEWKLKENDEEFTVMRVTLKGENADNKPVEVVYDLYDEYCKETQTSSMSRTTGYTATAAVNMILEGIFQEKGVFPPELVGKNEKCYQYIFEYLKTRGVEGKISEKGL